MVALPLYLLSSALLPSLGPLTQRSAEPLPGPTPDGTNSSPASNPFGSVIGPLVSSNFPDPAIIYSDGILYAFATNNREGSGDKINVQIATSSDNQTWTLLANTDALPHVGAWQTGKRVWAPDVVRLADGTFVLYYTDELTSSPAHHCIGAATATSILGPYTPQARPLACPDPTTLGGAIDPDGFLDPSTGQRYIVYKVDGNSIGHGGSCGNDVAPIVPTPILLQQVSPSDGITPIGAPIQILDRDDLDGPLVEAPTLHRSPDGVYFLFYSSQCYTTPQYNVAYATSTDIRGPYTKAARPLLVTSDAGLVGPGGLDILEGGDLVVFHAHIEPSDDSTTVTNAQVDNDGTSKAAQAPLVRGLWSAKVGFSGRDISLAG